MFQWIKKSLLAVIFIILIILLIVSNLFLILTLSLSYDNVRESAIPYLKELLYQKFSEDQVLNLYDSSKRVCENDIQVDFNVRASLFNGKYEFPRLSLNCQELAITNNQTFDDLLIEKALFIHYYSQEKIDCSFFSCLKTFSSNPLIFLSESGKNFFFGKFLWIAGFIIFLVLLTFFLFENKNNYLAYLGILLILSSLSTFILMKLNLFIENSDIIILKIISILLSQSKSIFALFISIGAVFLIIGIVLEIIKKKEEKEVNNK